MTMIVYTYVHFFLELNFFLVSGNLKTLETLQVDDNPLKYPPLCVIKQGLEHVLMFLRANMKMSKFKMKHSSKSIKPNLEAQIIITTPKDQDDLEIEDSSLKTDESKFDQDVFIEETPLQSPCRQKLVRLNSFDGSYASEESSRVSSIDESLSLDLSEKNHSSDSGRDTLNQPPTPSSPCLLTPDHDLPSSSKYNVVPEINTSCRCENSYCYDSEFNRKCYCKSIKNEQKIEQDQTMYTSNDVEYEDGNSEMKNRNQKKQLHLVLQRNAELDLGPDFDLEDDQESLDGDIGEGYRKSNCGNEDLSDFNEIENVSIIWFLIHKIVARYNGYSGASLNFMNQLTRHCTLLSNHKGSQGVFYLELCGRDICLLRKAK